MDPEASRVKLVMLGSGGVGKSTLVVQYVQRIDMSVYDPTIEDQYLRAATVDGKSYLVDIMELGAQSDVMSENYLEHIVKNADAFLVVFAVDDRSTFDKARTFVDTVRRQHPDNQTCSILLVGNKIDLEDARTVRKEEGERLAEKLGLPGYVETTAKDFDSTEAAFNELLVLVGKQREREADAAAERRKRTSGKHCAIL